MMGLFLFYGNILVVSYVIIHRIASRHAKNAFASNMTSHVQTQKNTESLTRIQYASTKAILTIVLAFMLLHLPMAIHLVVFETHTNLRNNQIRRILHAVSYICIQVNSFVSMHVYVAKIDECKLKFYLILARVLKSYDTKAEELRIKVYDIVVSTKART